MSEEIASLHATIAIETALAQMQLRRVRESLGDVHDTLKRLDTATIRASQSMGNSFSGLNQNLFFLKENFGQLVEIGRFGFSKLEDGARKIELGDSLALQLQGTGQSVDVLVGKLNQAAGGTVSDFNLMGSASRLMALQVTTDANQMAQLMEIARFKARQMGTTATSAFGDLATGIGKLEPEILDNLGIVIKLDEAYRAYAQTTGRTVQQLSAQEKRQIVLNQILSEGMREIEASGGVLQNQADKLRILQVEWDKATSAATKYAAASFGRAVVDPKGGGNKVENFFAGAAMGDAQRGAVDEIFNKTNDAVLAVSLNIKALSGDYQGFLDLVGTNSQALQVYTQYLKANGDAYLLTDTQLKILLYGQQGYNDALIDAKNATLVYSNANLVFDQSLRFAREAAERFGDSQIDNKNAVVGTIAAQAQATFQTFELGNGFLFTTQRGNELSPVLSGLASLAQMVGGSFAGALGGVMSFVSGLDGMMGLMGEARRFGMIQSQLDPKYGLQIATRDYANARRAYENALMAGGDQKSLYNLTRIAHTRTDLAQAELNFKTAKDRLHLGYSFPTISTGGAGGVGGAAGMSEAETTAQAFEQAWQTATSNIKNAVLSAFDTSITVTRNQALMAAGGIYEEQFNEAGRQLEDIINRGAESPFAAQYFDALLGDDAALKAAAAKKQDEIAKFLDPSAFNTDAALKRARETLIGNRNRENLATQLTQQLIAEGFANDEIAQALKDSLGIDTTLAQDIAGDFVNNLTTNLAAKQTEIKEIGRSIRRYIVEADSENGGGSLVDILVAQAMERIAERLETL